MGISRPSATPLQRGWLTHDAVNQDALFDSGNPDGSQPNTRNVLKAHDDASDLHCVRLVCPKTTAYKWDPDQM